MNNDSGIVTALEGLAHAAHGRGGDVTVFLCKVKENRAGDVLDQVEVLVDPPTVIADGRVDIGAGRRNKREHAAHAKAQRANQTGAGVQVLNSLHGALEIGGHERDIQAAEQCKATLESLGIVGEVDSGRLAPEDIGRNHHEAIGRVLVGHCTNVLVDTEDFLNEEQARATAGGGLAYVGIELTSIGTFHRNPFAGHWFALLSG